MSVIYVLLAISIAVAIIFFVAFIISVKNGQYDDSYTPAVRMLFEDELVVEKPSDDTRTEKKHSFPPSQTATQTVEPRQTDCRASIAITNKKSN